MKEQNPFSFYDFLGYLIPGFLSLLIAYYIQQLQKGYEFICIISNLEIEPSLTQSVILIIVSYFVGHILNFISSITVEKYSYWKYDYPSKYLMGIQHSKDYFIGPTHVRIWRFIVGLILFPIVIGDYVFGKKLSFSDIFVKKLDSFLIQAIKTKGIKLFLKLNLNVPAGRIRDYDYHRIFAHYVVQNSEATNGKTSNYLALYGYLRCMSTILSFSFWITFYYLCKSVMEYTSIRGYISEQIHMIYTLFTLIILCYICFMAFMKFYRRYSLENLMTIVSMDI